MGCGVFFAQLNNINTALGSLSALGFTSDLPVMKELNRMRSELFGRRAAGQSLPRVNLNLRTISGLSPGLVRVWFDIESGFMVEGRVDPQARPVYNPISTGEAFRLLREYPDVDLAHELMVKVPDIDN